MLTKLPPIETTISSFSPGLLETLLDELSTLSSVYYKPAKSFIDPNAYSRVPVEKKNKTKIEDLKNMAKEKSLLMPEMIIYLILMMMMMKKETELVVPMVIVVMLEIC